MSNIDYSAAAARWLPGPEVTISELHRAIRKLIHDYQVSSYEGYSFEMEVIPILRSNDPSLDPSRTAHDAPTLLTASRRGNFALKPRGQENPRKARVELDNQDVIQFCFYRKRRGEKTTWRPLAEYIRQQPLVLNPNRDLAINCYDRFKLIGPRIEPYPDMKHRSRTGLYATSTIDSALLYVNKQTSEEMRNHIYEFTPWLIVHRYILRRLVGNENFPVNRLKCLTLDLRHDDFLKLFGLTIIDLGRVQEEGVGREESSSHSETVFPFTNARWAFEDMDLLSLELVMPSPSRLCDVEAIELGCQRKAVDLILESAWPFLKGLPITLTGYVKTDQKAAFEAKALVAYKMKKEKKDKDMHKSDETDRLELDDGEEGGVFLDGSGAVAGWDVAARAMPAAEVASSKTDVCACIKCQEPAADEPEEFRDFVEVQEAEVPEHVIPVLLPLVCECKTHCLGDWKADDESDFGDDA
ncbi:hypothetical protein BDV97DRAFT_364723 [Delphinella strobiligena]|nr:hypothetical protein BDV97DRAFT_364723 [Delphinella strobiligena]